MAPNFNTGTALASVAQGITKVWAQKHAEEVEEKQRNLQVLGNLVSGGLQAGTIKNPDEAFQFLFTQLGGGKGKGGKKGEIPDPVKRVIAATKLAGSRTAGGQEKPSFGGAPPAAGGAAPQFYSGPELAQSAADAKIAEAQRMDREVTAPMDARRAKLRIEEEQAKPLRGVRDPKASQDPDGKWTYKVRDPQGNALYTVPGEAPKETGALAERTKELVAQGIPEDRASQVAALQLDRERGQKQQQASARLGAYLAMSRQALLTNTERYNEMRTLFPTTLAMKIANLDTAEVRSTIAQATQGDLVRRSAANADTAEARAATTQATQGDVVRRSAANADTAEARATVAQATQGDLVRRTKAMADTAEARAAQGPKDPAPAAAARVVAAATKTAASLAAKQSTILTSLGIDPDEATIRRNLIQEMSGGADPEAVERLAQQATTAAPAKAGTPSSSIKGRQSAIEYLKTNKLPVTDKNIQHYLDTVK